MQKDDRFLTAERQPLNESIQFHQQEDELKELLLHHEQESEDALAQELNLTKAKPKIEKYFDWAKYAIASAFCLFQIYTGVFGNIETQKQTHLTFVFVLGFLLFSCSKKHNNILTKCIDILFIIIGGIVGYYIHANFLHLAYSIGNPTPTDVLIGALLVLCIMELTRRSTGIALPILSIIFIIYAKWGMYFPYVISHGGFSWRRIFAFLGFSGEGIFGSPLAACANFIILYLVFAALLELSGGGLFFIDLGNGVAGKYRGGPAKTAVVASALFGSISGSAVANVVSTGSFTIPLMKKMGYQPEFAGAVESVASTGGQIMPPVMSAVAFIIAETLGINYGQVVVAATIPAFLYYFSCLTMVHLHSKKIGLKGLSPDMLPSVKQLLIKKGVLLVPLLVLIYLLIFAHASAQKAAVWGIVTMVVCSYLTKGSRLTPKRIIMAFFSAAKNSISVVAACSCSGLVIGVVTLSGLGVVFSQLIMNLAGGSLPIALILTMLASLILGMGVPTIASYVILSLVVAPSLVAMGVNELAAHMFILYFGVISNITPPVCLASFAAAGLAKCSIWKCGWAAFKLGIAGFIVPFMFIYSPGLLMDAGAIEVLLAVGFACLGVFGLACSIERYWLVEQSWLETALTFIAAVLLIDTRVVTSLVGLGLLLVVYLLQRTRGKNIQSAEKSV